MARLAITGLGLVSTVGHDLVTACGALRCGMTRTAPRQLTSDMPSGGFFT